LTYGTGQIQDLHLETVQDRAMPRPPKQSYSKKTVRLPADLWAHAEAEADRNGRTLNAEITAKLIEAYAQPTLADLAKRQDETRQLVRQVLDEVEVLNIRK
jgi:hypothetical protein